MPTIFTLRVNGTARSVRTQPDTPLLYVLRNDLKLNGAKFGCGQAQCGACSVLVDGIEQRSCVYPVSAAGKGRITTIEGLGTAQQPRLFVGMVGISSRKWMWLLISGCTDSYSHFRRSLGSLRSHRRPHHEHQG